MKRINTEDNNRAVFSTNAAAEYNFGKKNIAALTSYGSHRVS